MARELVVQKWCDICLATNATQTPSVVSLIVGNPEPPINLSFLDVCESHNDMKLSGVLDFLDEGILGLVDAEGGITPSAKPAVKASKPKPNVANPKERIPCPLCGDIYAAGSGMALHVKGSHTRKQYWEYMRDHALKQENRNLAGEVLAGVRPDPLED